MPDKTIALAGGSGFIGRAIARRLAAMPDMRARVMSRSPQRAREHLPIPNVEFVRAEVTETRDAAECFARRERGRMFGPVRGLSDRNRSAA